MGQIRRNHEEPYFRKYNDQWSCPCGVPGKDVDGEPVDHSKEFSYFAGCIGYTGGNQWSMNSKFENVHVRHIQIKSSATPSQNLGGLVGWIGSGGGNAGNRVAALKTVLRQMYISRDIRPAVLSDKC